MTYTKGPWVADHHGAGRGSEVHARDCQDVLVAYYGCNTSVGPDGTHAIRQDEAEANANLGAAAPEMLEALKWLAYGEHEWSAPPAAILFIDGVIAKAEGR